MIFNIESHQPRRCLVAAKVLQNPPDLLPVGDHRQDTPFGKLRTGIISPHFVHTSGSTSYTFWTCDERRRIIIRAQADFACCRVIVSPGTLDASAEPECRIFRALPSRIRIYPEPCRRACPDCRPLGSCPCCVREAVRRTLE